MAVTTAFCNSAKVEVLTGVHDFTASTGDVFKAALIKTSETGTYGISTTNYSNLTGNSDEATVGGGGSGYTAGGATLTNVTPVISSNVAIVDFSPDTVWTLTGASATLAASGCIIYNSSASNAAFSVHAFSGSPQASGDGATFTIQWPTPTNTTAIIRLA
jgi:hypothetical protein